MADESLLSLVRSLLGFLQSRKDSTRPTLYTVLLGTELLARVAFENLEDTARLLIIWLVPVLCYYSLPVLILYLYPLGIEYSIILGPFLCDR